MKIYLGPAGTPATSTIKGLDVIRQLGLQAMEVQFTHGIGMGLPLAKDIANENEKHEVKLSVHAPYYINLASEDYIKIEESKKRILDSCERAHLMGANNVVFHAAYYGKKIKEEIYYIVKDAILEMTETIKNKKFNLQLAP